MKILMEFESDFGTITPLEQRVESSYGSEVDFLSAFINNFMKAATFSSFDKDRVFLESVTGEEYEILLDYLNEIRKDKDKKDE